MCFSDLSLARLAESCSVEEIGKVCWHSLSFTLFLHLAVLDGTI